MRILLTTDTIGGVWTFSLELTRGLLTRGHEVLLISLGRDPDAQQTADVAALACADFRYEASNSPLEWMQNNEDIFQQNASAISEAIRDFDPEILHANQFTAAMMSTGVPCLLTVHSDVLSWAEATDTALAPAVWRERYVRIAEEGLASASMVVAPTQALADAVERIYQLERGLDVIPNGRTLEPAAQSTQRKLQAVSAGRLWDIGKGLSILRDIDVPLPVMLAGEQGSEGTAPIPANVHVLGTFSTSALHKLFAESAIYLAASIYEPFGLAALEAALCGCATVARDIPSLREVWADGALYFNSAPQLEALLRQLAGDPAALEAARQRSVARAQLYSADRMVDSYLKHYDLLQSYECTGPHEAKERAYAS